MNSRLPLLILAAMSCASLERFAMAQSVTVLTNGSGSALQSAIDSAADGDTILLHGGTYSACTIAGKSLNIVCEPSLGTTVESLAISGLTAPKQLTLAGLRVRAVNAGSTPGLFVQNCTGSVRLDTIDSVGVAVARGGFGVHASTDVSIANSISTGGLGANSTLPAASGLGVSGSSRLAVFDCVLTGGNGASGFLNPPWNFQLPAPGAPGAFVQGLQSQLHLVNALSQGGSGGYGCESTTGGCEGMNGADGGAGLFTQSPSVHTRSTIANGGAGGLDPTACPNLGPGANGPSISGTTIPHPGQPLSLQTSLLVREHQLIPITVTGTPGELIGLWMGSRGTFTPDASGANLKLVADPVRRIALGVVPAGGVLFRTIKPPALRPSDSSETLLLQVFAVESSGQLRFGPSVPLLVLDSAY